MKIARRFNAGPGIRFPQVPKGRLNRERQSSIVQPSPRDLFTLELYPGIKMPGYSQSSLRDERTFLAEQKHSR
jgi:hypothetical protein